MTYRQTVALGLGLVAIFAVALVIGVREAHPIREKPETPALVALAWSDLGRGALVGALAGAFGTHILRERAEHRRELRERNGLLRLLVGEIIMNRVTAERFREVPDVLYSAGSLAARAEEWAAARVRLAQLLPPEDFPKLAEYYLFVVALQNPLRNYLEARARNNRHAADYWRNIANAQIAEVENTEARALTVIENYIGVVDPRRLARQIGGEGEDQTAPQSEE